MSLSGLNFETFFREADVNNDGHLSLQELIVTLRKYGYKNRDDEIKAFFKRADTSGDNRVSFAEYMAAMSKAPVDFHSEAALRRIFSKYDRDGNGRIDRQELGAILKEMGKVFSDEEVKKMMSALDKDKSGYIDYEEFIEAVKARQI